MHSERKECGMTYLEQAIEKGYATIFGEGAKQRITYAAVNHSERFSDPEEQVRAEYWAELIFRYAYEPSRIGVEVTVPDRTPKDAADQEGVCTRRHARARWIISSF
jgi:type I restriction enzyme M protein